MSQAAADKVSAPQSRAHFIRLRGLVQGLGVRPALWRWANDCGLAGQIWNDAKGVGLLLTGENRERFIHGMAAALPPLARLETCRWRDIPLHHAVLPKPVEIIASRLRHHTQTRIGADLVYCLDCVRDICDPDNRRYRYPLTTCTHCGPRYSVSYQLPYDRSRTSLAPFPLCPDCWAEYQNPADRRFHAETTACPRCGPQLRLLDRHGKIMAGDAITETLRLLLNGAIVAIKGLGGFHLACRADSASTIARLRSSKARLHKPLAVMVLNPDSARALDLAHISAPAEAWLRHPARPIVLCPQGKRHFAGIAEGLDRIGIMLPATPIQLLLWHEAMQRPGGTHWLARIHPMCLVMTSANPGGEPLVIDNEEAQQRLNGLADAFLLHDRAIARRCDDSVLVPEEEGNDEEEQHEQQRLSPNPNINPNHNPNHKSILSASTTNHHRLLFPPQFIRRARGFVPTPIPLFSADQSHQSRSTPPVLALGAYLKTTCCALRGSEAFFSPHVGSLDNGATLDFLAASARDLCQLLDIQPAVIACDAHPDYPSSHLATELARHWGAKLLPCHHHHAHLAALLAEKGGQSLIGLALDGIGLGPDQGLWGGELLAVDRLSCRRLGHLLPLALPGGDVASRQPWRMAVSALHADGWQESAVSAWLAQVFPARQQDLPLLWQMLNRRVQCPLSSSLGRVFDAAAALLGLTEVNDHEGQAAMRLESLARQAFAVTVSPAPFSAQPGDGAFWHIDSDENGIFVLDLRPLLRALPSFVAAADEGGPGRGAAFFHRELAHALCAWVCRALPALNQDGNPSLSHDSGKHTPQSIGVSGGCAQNTLLMQRLGSCLRDHGYVLFRGQLAPNNDGGLSLGQAWLARQSLLSSSA